MTYILNSKEIGWTKSGWWNNFIDWCDENIPDYSGTRQYCLEELQKYSGRYEKRYANTPSYDIDSWDLIFDTKEDYFAFVLEWS
jgi:hypothetical protein